MSTTATHVTHYGRAFRILATFPESDTAAANAFMEANPGAGLLCIRDGMAYLAHESDNGLEFVRDPIQEAEPIREAARVLATIADMLESHPDHARGNAKIHYCAHEARAAFAALKLATSPAILAALREVLPYAENEAEALSEAARRDNGEATATEAARARQAVEQARAALAAAGIA